MSKEYNIEPIEESTKECSSCKKSINSIPTGMLIASFYMLGSSIYGTVKLVQLIMSLF